MGPLHLICLLALCPLLVQSDTPTATFDPEEITMNMGYYEFIDIVITGPGLQAGDSIALQSRQDYVVEASWNSTFTISAAEAAADLFTGRMRVDGNFLGRTFIDVEIIRGLETIAVNGNFPVVIIRPQRVIDTIFVYFVAIFISLIFINFGCAMHWPTVKSVLKRPIGPLIGMGGQFLFMPLMTFGLGFLIFPDNPALHLGMFFTGVSPGGGASNIWTFILGGNLNLSLAMTSISTICSFGFIPAWLFSLGQVVFRNANIGVPYRNIATFVVGLLVPLAIGLGMQKFTPRLASFMVRILKGFSTLLLLGIIVFAIATNLYIFELFTWQILIAGMGVPWLGYSVGYLVARLLKQPHPDALAISIETGVQNTGIAIFMLRYALEQPEADITTVIPVSVAIMTPIPMTLIYIYQKIKGCIDNRNKVKNGDMNKEVEPTPVEFVQDEPTPVDFVEGGQGEPPIVTVMDDKLKR